MPPKYGDKKIFSKRAFALHMGPGSISSTKRKKKNKQKTRIAHLTPVELAHYCMGKRLEPMAASMSLQTAVLILCPSWAFRACRIAACHLFAHSGCRVPEHGWDLSTGLMPLAKDKV